MTNQVSPQFYTLGDAATLLNVSRDTIERRIADGTLKGYYVAGRAIRVRKSELDALIVPIPTVVTQK